MDGRVVRCVARKSHAAVDLLIGGSRLILSRIGRQILSHIFARTAAIGVNLRCALRFARAMPAAGAVVAALSVAYADGIAVTDRPRPDYDAKGVPLGAFRLFPVVNVGIAVSDNVFQASAATDGDVNIQVAPAIRLVSEWSQHLLEFFASLNAQRYADFSSEDVADWELGARGRLDIQRGTAVFADVSRSKGHEGRSSPNSPGNIAELVQYSLYHAEASMSVQPNRMRFLVGGEFNRYSYDATPLLGGGFLDNGDRDRDEYRLRARVSLEVAEGYLAFVEAAYDNRDFDRDIDRTGVNRDSNGTSLNAGFEFKLVEFLQGEAFIGHLDRQFGAPLSDFSGFNYGASLKWSATPLTTVHVSASRILDETTVAGSSVVADSMVGLGIDHELRRNLIVQASVAHVDSEFIGTPREDTYIEGRVGATYLIDRNLSANAAYEHRERDSNVAGEDFSEDRFNVGLRLQF